MTGPESTDFTYDIQPPTCSDMIVLDRNKFELVVPCRAIKVPCSNCSEVMKRMKCGIDKFSHLQHKPKIILPDENDGSHKLILVSDNENISNLEEFKIVDIEIKLSYKNWSVPQILRAILPTSINDADVISGFEIIGHIAHLNLKESHEKYKQIIGQVILDKNPSIKTVVNKLNSINAQFRYFDMEILAGENNLLTTAIEHKIKYEMDFSKVYWNSRLSSEHKRLVDSIPSGSVVLDMFCGIGPFALPLAKKHCYVHANDLNPDSYLFLNKNIKLNKISPEYIKSYNEDGRDFIRNFDGPIDYILMNLPATATEFLDVFQGLYSGRDASLKSPIVYCYHFASIEDPKTLSVKAVSDGLGCAVSPHEVHLVRKTSPGIWMTCVKFCVPSSVLFSESKEKRLKLDDT